MLVIAVVPAVCEELAFRGFILSGFRHLGHKWRAIIYSAVLFGLAHGILQQSLIACLLGVVLGFLAVQSGSILPGIVFHVVHNTLGGGQQPHHARDDPEFAVDQKTVLPADGGGCLFEWPLVVVGLLAAVLVLMWFGRLNSAEIAGRGVGGSHRARHPRKDAARARRSVLVIGGELGHAVVSAIRV